jgi:hypothetical protein
VRKWEEEKKRRRASLKLDLMKKRFKQQSLK